MTPRTMRILAGLLAVICCYGVKNTRLGISIKLKKYFFHHHFTSSSVSFFAPFTGKPLWFPFMKLFPPQKDCL